VTLPKRHQTRAASVIELDPDGLTVWTTGATHRAETPIWVMRSLARFGQVVKPIRT
jgi:hypothetical protein